MREGPKHSKNLGAGNGVARPRNHEDPTITAIRLDGGFFVP